MLKILSSAFGLSVQDMGRTQHSSVGVPVSGVMDAYATKIANMLLQNAANAAVLEVTFGGCSLQFETACSICISGADFSPTLDGQPVRMHSVLHAPKGAILTFGKRKFGVRSYIAVAGGLQTEKVLGSRSMYKGITPHATITKGTQLKITETDLTKETSHAYIKVPEEHFTTQTLNCYPGPEFDQLTETQQQQLFNTQFTIGPNNSRMGYQLEEMVPNDFPSMLTSAVLQGTVQLTPSGKLIVLMRDCQVTGGYPRVLQLTESAINQLAQKTMGDRFAFAMLALD